MGLKKKIKKKNNQEALIIFYVNLNIFAGSATIMLSTTESCSFSPFNTGYFFLSLLHIEGLQILFTIGQNFHLVCVVVFFKNPFCTSLT